MPAATAKVKANVRLVGERLEGAVQLVQRDVSIQPQVAQGAKQVFRRLAEGVGDRLASIDEVTSELTLAGTIHEPDFAIRSSLGPVITDAFQGAAMSLAESELRQQADALQSQVSRELAGLEQMVAETTQQISDQLGAPAEQIEQVASALLGSPAGRGTISFEQLGKQLPVGGSLFK